MLAEAGQITLRDLYTDGTKIEASSNRYTFVWGKAIKTNKAKMLKHLDELWAYAQRIEQGDQEASKLEIDDLHSSKIDAVIEQIDQGLHAQVELLKDKALQKKLNTVKKTIKLD